MSDWMTDREEGYRARAAEREQHESSGPRHLGPEADRESPPPNLEGGVWALLDDDYITYITAVYATELEALRVINGRGYGRAAFIKWGHTANGEPVETS